MSKFTLTRQTVGDLLARNADTWASRDACVFVDSQLRMSWAELHARAQEAARGLMALGVEPGDHVAIWGTNRPEWLFTQLGAALIGAPLVTINPEWKEAELEFGLKQSDTRILVMFPGFEKTSGEKRHVYDYPKILGGLLPELDRFDDRPIATTHFPCLERVVLVADDAPRGYLTWQELIDRGQRVPEERLEEVRAEVTCDEVVLIQYTSGTTGFPKGAMLTHHGVVNNARSAAHNLGLSEADRICVTVPYYHCFGSIIVNLGSLVSGAATVVPSEHFDPHLTLEAVDRERCTVLHGVPTMFINELEDVDFDAHDLSSLRTGVMAGAPCPAELMNDVMQKMGLREITIGFGLTEASPLTHQTLPGDPLDKRIHTVGLPIPCTVARVVDTTTLQELPAGEVGEIWVSGYNVMKGYYRRPVETAATIHDGWLRTGDLGLVDEEGYFRIVGRLKNLIIVGGHNVYPAEVEQTIHSLFQDQVDIVQVVGVPHARLQEVVAAVVRLREGQRLNEAEVLLRCKDVMEWPKVPRHIYFVDDLSEFMTATGKIQKFKLRERIVEEMLATA